MEATVDDLSAAYDDFVAAAAAVMEARAQSGRVNTAALGALSASRATTPRSSSSLSDSATAPSASSTRPRGPPPPDPSSHLSLPRQASSPPASSASSK
ncbi:unnamed protein product [Urochloa humidicola]